MIQFNVKFFVLSNNMPFFHSIKNPAHILNIKAYLIYASRGRLNFSVTEPIQLCVHWHRNVREGINIIL